MSECQPLLLIRSGQPEENCYGPFAQELLIAEGLNGFRVVDIDAAGLPYLRPEDLVVLTRCFLQQSEINAIYEAVESGARLVCLQPSPRLLERFQWRSANSVLYSGRVLVRPGYRGAGAPLQTHVPIALAEPADPSLHWECVAEACSDDGQKSGRPAIARQRVGAGEVVFYFFDLPKAVARIRFGDPELASFATMEIWDWPHAAGLFTGYLDDNLRHLPVADLHTQLLAQLLSAISAYPLTRFWYYEEAGHRAAAVFSSDDDGSTPEQFRELTDALQRHGAHGTFYLVKDTRLGDDEIARMRGLGHTFAPHIDARSDSDMFFGFPGCVEEESALLRARIGSTSVSLQAHRAPWYGYQSYVPHFVRNGYRLLMHYLSAPVHRLNSFLCGSGRPSKFVALDGKIHDCWQQPLITFDDASLIPRINNDCATLLGEFERLLEGCCREHHSSIGLASHPVSFATYSRPFIEACLAALARKGVPVYNGDEWCALHDRRHAARVKQRFEGDTLTCTVSNLTGRLQLMIPAGGTGAPPARPRVSVDGAAVEGTWQRRLGEDYLFVPVEGDGSRDVQVHVDFTPWGAMR